LRGAIRREIEDLVVNHIIEKGEGAIKTISASYKNGIEISLK
jgi:hypothetical protein